MGKKKKDNGRRGNRFFRWIRSDLPDSEDKKSPVLLIGVNKITDSPSNSRRRSIEPQTTGSIRFFRPPKSKYTRVLHGDERLEKIRQDLLTHKQKSENHIPTTSHEASLEPEAKNCLRLNCAGNCICDRKRNSSNRGSFSFRRPGKLSSATSAEVHAKGESKDSSENDIEFKYTEHIPNSQPGTSKQNSYNITPKSSERRHFLLANLNERFRKTLSLDSRKIDTNRVALSLPQEKRPKSLVNTSNFCVQQHKAPEPIVTSNFTKTNQPKKKRKSFFSLDTFFDSKKSDTSSVDDYCSSKYKRFELEGDDSPLFRDKSQREKTPDLLNLSVIIDSVRKKQSDTKRQLQKLESHFYKSFNKTQTVIDAIPKDATDVQGPSGHTNNIFVDDDDVEYIEPIRSNFTSQSTLILDKNIPENTLDSILSINTDETDIKLSSSTISPKSNEATNLEHDLDSLGAYEIEVKESDLLKDYSKDLTVLVMDKSIDSIGSCSLDVDASTDFSDTTSGSLNILTPSSTNSHIRDFTSRLQDRAANIQSNKPLHHTPILTPVRTPEEVSSPKKSSQNHLKPPTKLHAESGSHRSRGHHKKRDEIPQKKPSYLNLACSVNGYTNLTTYDSKLRQDINKSREASPIRPIIHYQYRTENNSLLVPIPVSNNKLLVQTFSPHDTQTNLTSKAPTKAQTDPYSVTPLHILMAAENKQLKKDFLHPKMTMENHPFQSTESKTFVTSMLHKKDDEVDNTKEITFKSSFSETNFMKTTTNTKESHYVSSESYTISSNGTPKRMEFTKENGEKLTSPMKSFIQQRVERLYGPGALAQGFFNQKRHSLQGPDPDSKVLTEKSLNCPSRRLSTPKNMRSNLESENIYSSPKDESDLSLPVLRHLRPEFRAQLPILSPKKSLKMEVQTQTFENIPISIEKTEIPVSSAENPTSVNSSDLSVKDEKIVDLKKLCLKDKLIEASDEHENIEIINLTKSELEDDQIGLPTETVNGAMKTNGVKETVKDAHYFLNLKKKETERLIALAVTAETELANLENKDVSEEVLGLLRSASGKARLLATQKMQQFEGLCYNNINEKKDEPFPTTVEDLQGFWDMVCLQVRNVDALYEQIELVKANNWQEIVQLSAKPPTQATQARVKTRAAPLVKNEKARLAAEKREADRKAILEHRRRVARERQLASRAAAGSSRLHEQDMSLEGSQEVEIFVSKASKPVKVAPKGDCQSDNQAEDSALDRC